MQVIAAVLLLILQSSHSLDHVCQHTPLPLTFVEQTFSSRNHAALANQALRQSLNKRSTVPLCDPHSNYCETQPLRLFFDKRYLATPGVAPQDPSACARVGQTVLIQGRGSAQADTPVRCTAEMIMTGELYSKLLVAMAFVEHEVNQVLSVIPAERIVYPANVEGWCSGDLDMSPYKAESSGDEVFHDVALMVTSRPTVGKVLAWASSCIANQYGRPVLGHMNLGVNALMDAPIAQIQSVVLHEVFHALGFSKASLAGRFVDPETGVLKPFDQVVRVLKTSSDKKVAPFLITESVRDAWREHSGCDSLPGGELHEDLSHWAGRVSQGELMSPVITNDATAILSAATLAYMKDTGYYDVNFRGVGQVAFMKNSGCDVVRGFCGDWPMPYGACYLDNEPKNHCSVDRKAFGSCPWFEYTSPDGGCALTGYEVTNGTDCNTGGAKVLDYCALSSLGQFCSDEDAIAQLNQQQGGAQGVVYLGQKGGAESRCFEAAVVQKGYSANQKSAGCFPRRCSDSNVLEIQVGDAWLSCPVEGGMLSVDTEPDSTGVGYNGELECPPSAEMCCSCSDHGTCVLGHCVCDVGFKGETCSEEGAQFEGDHPNPAKWASNPFTNPLVNGMDVIDLPSGNDLGKAEHDPATGMSSGAVAAIVIIFLLILCLAIAAAAYFVYKKRSN